jgi:hypothetical protein
MSIPSNFITCGIHFAENLHILSKEGQIKDNRFCSIVLVLSNVNQKRTENFLDRSVFPISFDCLFSFSFSILINFIKYFLVNYLFGSLYVCMAIKHIIFCLWKHHVTVINLRGVTTNKILELYLIIGN